MINTIKFISPSHKDQWGYSSSGNFPGWPSSKPCPRDPGFSHLHVLPTLIQGLLQQKRVLGRPIGGLCFLAWKGHHFCSPPISLSLYFGPTEVWRAGKYKPWLKIFVIQFVGSATLPLNNNHIPWKNKTQNSKTTNWKCFYISTYFGLPLYCLKNPLIIFTYLGMTLPVPPSLPSYCLTLMKLHRTYFPLHMYFLCILWNPSSFYAYRIVFKVNHLSELLQSHIQLWAVSSCN